MDPVSVGKMGAELVVAALLVFVVTYQVKTLIPNLQKQFSDDLERVTKGFMDSQTQVVAALDKMSIRIERLEHAVDKNTVMVTAHDLTVRGLNSETIGTTKDILDAIRNGRPSEIAQERS